jgi:putative spermidine/putrescine transport system permease protein
MSAHPIRIDDRATVRPPRPSTTIRPLRRPSSLRTWLLLAPLLAFLAFGFVIPLLRMAQLSVYDPTLRDLLPATAHALAAWDRGDLPGDAVYNMLAQDMIAAREAQSIGIVATRLNTEISGIRSVVLRTARQLGALDASAAKDWFVGQDPLWGAHGTWQAIARLTQTINAAHYVAALDLRYDEQGAIRQQEPDRRIHRALFLRTLGIGATVTVLCILLGYPVAFLLTTVRAPLRNYLFLLVLLPFWTSLLVRTTAWIVLLQSQGVVNDALVGLGIISNAHRMSLIYNMTGTVVTMTHILLPFFILPLYSVMSSIPPSYMRAALSLGARPAFAFRRVYLPCTLPGVTAGALLVFILAIGYYVTPALVGGQSGQMISNVIAFHMQSSLNWGLASALGVLLLGIVGALFILYDQLVGLGRVRLG